MGELEEMFARDDVQARFKALDVNATDAWTMFKLMDKDDTNSLDVDEFMGGIMNLKGHARVLDLAASMHETRFMLKNVSRSIVAMEDNVTKFHTHLKSLHRFATFMASGVTKQIEDHGSTMTDTCHWTHISNTEC